MKTRAAVFFEAKQPIGIVELDLEGPKAGEMLRTALEACHRGWGTSSSALPRPARKSPPARSS